MSQRELQATRQELEQPKRPIAELEQQLGGKPTQKVLQPFSLRAEEQRQQARGKKRRQRKRRSQGGRRTTAEKIAQAVRSERVFPVGVPETVCRLSHTRPVWRLENGHPPHRPAAGCAAHCRSTAPALSGCFIKSYVFQDSREWTD
jgi:hypothetical protein